MTKTKLFGIIAATVVVSALLGVTMISESESQVPTPPPGLASDVVVLNCGDLASAFITNFASSSANAPAVPTANTNCAQNLANLLDAGFEIQNVSPGTPGNIYTLIRSNDI